MKSLKSKYKSDLDIMKFYQDNAYQDIKEQYLKLKHEYEDKLFKNKEKDRQK